MNTIFLLPFLVSILIAFFSTPLVILVAKKMGIIDDPKKNIHPKVIHTYPVPRGGGLATFVSIFISGILFLPLDIHLKAILAGGFFVTMLGLLDDKYDLNPYLRYFFQFAIAVIPISAGVGISFITSPINGIIDLSLLSIDVNVLGLSFVLHPLADIFALFWIVFIMNILNMGAKGVDGQLPGVVLISALTIAFLSLKFSADITQWSVIVLALITAGAYLGFLPWNIYPQKIMPSFAGSTLAGYMLAILSILSTAKVGTLFVVLGIPLIDTGYVIIRRILSGKSPVWGDRGHLHHRLLDLGFSKRSVSVFYWAITAILGIFAVNLNASQKLYTMIGVAAMLAGFTLWVTYRPKK